MNPNDDNQVVVLPGNQSVDNLMSEGGVSVAPEQAKISENTFGGLSESIKPTLKESSQQNLALADKTRIDGIRQELGLIAGGVGGTDVRVEEKPLRKVRPEPRADRRFSLSKEQFSKDRIRALKETIDDLKSSHPEVISFMMFGSMAKGTAHEESDIDGYLFVDADMIPHASGEQPVVQGEDYQREYFDSDTSSKYGGILRGEIKDKTGLTDEQVKHMRILPISTDIIDNHIAELGRRVDIREDHRRRMREYLDASGQERNERGLKFPEYPKVIDSSSINLSAMFFLEVGKGIESYRAHLINKLSGMGERGEVIWGRIIAQTESFEQNLQTNTGRSYPRTLEQARATYAAKSTQ